MDRPKFEPGYVMKPDEERRAAEVATNIFDAVEAAMIENLNGVPMQIVMLALCQHAATWMCLCYGLEPTPRAAALRDRLVQRLANATIEFGDWEREQTQRG